MIKKITQLFSLLVVLSSSALYGQLTPELLYYKFDGTGTTVPNLASAPPVGTATANIMGGLTQGGSSICQGTIIGTGVASSSDYVNTGWTPNLGAGSWTISFRTENITASATLFYIFGDVNTASFRCFTNGVAGANNWILRGAGLNDVLVTGGATVAPHMTTFVYDAAANNVKAYLDGVLVNTVAQTAPNLTGTGPLKVVGYSANVGMPLNGHFDEFRLYSRALTAAEVAQLYNPYSTSGFLGADVSFCTGGSTQLQLPGTWPYSTINWSTGSTAISSGVINTTSAVTVSLSGTCGTGSDTVLVTEVAPPTLALGADVSQCGGNVVLDAGAGNYSYMWSDATTNQTLNVSASGAYSVTKTDLSSGCSVSDTINITINPDPTFSLGADVVQCGGSVFLEGPVAPYAYLWSDNSINSSLNVSTSGAYTLMVTDSATGCMYSDTVLVTINSIPSPNLGNDITQCGGSVVLNAVAGAYSYLWSDNSINQQLTVNASGAYAVQVTDSATGCAGNDTILVTINALPTVALGADQTQCGGSVLLDAGAGAYSYLWSDNSTAQQLTVTSTGVYAVTLTDSLNGCSNSDTILVTINPIPPANFGGVIFQCGGSVTLDAGAGPYTYLWSDNSTNQTLVVTTNGFYTVMVTDTVTGCVAPYPGCIGCDTALVYINTPPVVTLTLGATTVCEADAPTVLSGTPAGGVFSGPGVSGNQFDPSVAGSGVFTITYTYTDANNCSGTDAATITVNPCVGITETTLNSSIDVFPNPTTGMMNLVLPANLGDVVVELVDLSGQVVYSEQLANTTNAATNQISMTTYDNGIYFLRLHTANGVVVKRVVKQD